MELTLHCPDDKAKFTHGKMLTYSSKHDGAMVNFN